MIGMGVVNIAADGRVLPGLTLSKLRPVIAASGSLLPKAIDIYATLILTNLELRERRPAGEKLVVVVNSLRADQSTGHAPSHFLSSASSNANCMPMLMLAFRS